MAVQLAPLILQGVVMLPDLIERVTTLFDRLSNGELTQEQFDQEWAAMNADWHATSAAWDAAGQTDAAKAREAD